MPAPKGHPPYPGCEKGGAPTYWTEARIEEEAEALYEWVKSSKDFWFLDYCVKREIHYALLSRLAKKSEKFRHIYQLARQKQESIVAYGCLTRKLDPGFGWRFLTSHYKWTESEDRGGLEQNEATPGSRALADVRETCIEHANTVEQTGDKSSQV